MLEFATIEGARVCGLEERTGSLTPGKQADIVMLRCDDTNTYPVIDPVSTVVLQADTRNVDSVFVGGEVAEARTARSSTPTCAVHVTAPRRRSTISSGSPTIQPNWVQSARGSRARTDALIELSSTRLDSFVQ